MTQEELIVKINNVLADEFEVDVNDISPESSLMETLDLDSLDMVDVVVLINANFAILLKDTDFIGIKTFQNFYDLLLKKINETKQ